jgi:hypothetical protein
MLAGGLAATLGVAAGPAVLTLVGAFEGHVPFVVQMVRFSRTAATQCDLTEGWRLPWAYLWHAEHGLLLLWIGVTATALLLPAPRRANAWGRMVTWVGASVLVYGLIALSSTGLGWFGAYGRGVRALVPFASLATAAAGAILMDRQRRVMAARPWLAAGLVAHTVLNFGTPVRQRFPGEYARARPTSAGVPSLPVRGL